ncbi:probable alpha-ketoglutarate-dependent hypophosphite dioxygenase [Hydractinia symbiolongicarpus]|uniref:probable alpha-ketoglutarate-dependent hypophosphite dioxygenase n=1 Tax=Hydractinia symbiolongicarpus TaxID=13093 RepID=UPI00254ABAD1|nr:probable alpha-ketoglutarate-dependent hypophosphite dioxygenase [Hydractinia symbiolongicarpus]
MQRHSIKLFLRRFTLSQRRSLKYLTSNQVDQYNNDGYVVANSLLNKEEITEARKALEQLIDRSRSTARSDEIYELQDDHNSEHPKVERIKFPSEQHPVFKKLLNHPKLLNAVEDLIGPSFRYMPQDKLNVKPAGHGGAIRWHQDWAFFPHTNDSVLTASVLLYDSIRENGCLQVIPKSHKGPIISHFHDGKFVSTITETNFQTEDSVYLEAPAGSVTLHHVRIIHGSARNTSTLPRSVVCFIYNAMDAWPLLGVAGSDFKNTGPVDFDMFDKTRLRGEKCITPRLEKVPVHLPVPFDYPSTVFDMQFEVEEPQA